MSKKDESKEATHINGRGREPDAESIWRAGGAGRITRRAGGFLKGGVIRGACRGAGENL